MASPMHYPGFRYAASELSAFIYVAAANKFIVALKTKTIVHYVATDKESFIAWLLAHKIRDVGRDIRL